MCDESETVVLVKISVGFCSHKLTWILDAFPHGRSMIVLLEGCVTRYLYHDILQKFSSILANKVSLQRYLTTQRHADFNYVYKWSRVVLEYSYNFWKDIKWSNEKCREICKDSHKHELKDKHFLNQKTMKQLFTSHVECVSCTVTIKN